MKLNSCSVCIAQECILVLLIGDKHASPEFFRGLHQVLKRVGWCHVNKYVSVPIYNFIITCTQNNVRMIIDEVQTGGGGTGYMWSVLNHSPPCLTL